MSVNLDKPSALCVWNATREAIEGSRDDADDEQGAAVVIRRLSWMAPQTSSPDGCLFAVLGKSNLQIFLLECIDVLWLVYIHSLQGQ